MAQKNEVSLDTDELIALIKLDLEKGNIEKALLKLKEVIKDKNVPSEAYAIAARTYAQLGLFERAKDNFNRYLENNPDATTELFQLGMSHLDCGEKQEALGIWDRLLKKAPVHPPALFYKGLVLAQSGKIADAKQSLDTLLKSANVDNLYFGRAKELLQSIANDQLSHGNNGGEQTTTLPKGAYQQGH